MQKSNKKTKNDHVKTIFFFVIIFLFFFLGMKFNKSKVYQIPVLKCLQSLLKVFRNELQRLSTLWRVMLNNIVVSIPKHTRGNFVLKKSIMIFFSKENI